MPAHRNSSGILWIFLSLAAAIVWGIDYLFAEKAMQKISPLTFMAIEMTVATIVLLPFAYFSNLKTDLTFLGTDKKTTLSLTISTIAFICGSMLIVSSIHASNATWAGLLEISYPLFTILLGWLIFREHHLNLPVVVGGIMIFGGVFLISYFGSR